MTIGRGCDMRQLMVLFSWVAGGFLVGALGSVLLLDMWVMIWVR
jgi:hypothetical protein